MKHSDETRKILDNMLTRMSVRKFKPSMPVDDSDVETLLRAAMSAPSACNKQPWRFLVIRQPETLVRLGQTFQNAHMAKEAPLAILVCGDRSAFFEGEGEPYWTQDCSAAIENMLLAAHAMGLGAVWCGIYPLSERVDMMTRFFSLPYDIIPMSVVVIGHPDQSPSPKDKWNPSHVHYDRW